ncbi:hypothetical protein [Orenia marismortui]|uniref:hypothetical protein n=1 Tax=Orenia marismortui TaxID=46469 RepID=UPI000378C8BB|nr:hypothetical protein [Orenia marismortui]
MWSVKRIVKRWWDSPIEYSLGLGAIVFYFLDHNLQVAAWLGFATIFFLVFRIIEKND